jgi:hypothetical protein
MKTLATPAIGAFIVTQLLIPISAHAQTSQIHQVCIGEYESTCRKYQITDWYGCGDTRTNAICFRYCGQPETPQTCTVTRRQTEPGNKCGYSWVTVQCLKR